MTHDKSQSDEKIGRLIAAAGPGPSARPESRERIRAAVRASWQESLRQRGRGDARDDAPDGAPAASGQRRAGASRFRLFGLAATVAMATLVLYWIGGGPGEVARAELARIDRIDGAASLVRDDDTLRLTAASAAGPIVAGDILRTSGNGQVALRLDDGLLLRVNVDTELAFAGPDTIDLVQGTVYVDSGAEASGTALAIDTPFGSVTHLGTQYEVRFADAGLRLRVREGSVRFSGAAGPAVVGAAGEQLEIGADGLSSRSVIAADDAAWGWAVALAALPEAPEYQVGATLRWAAREQGLAVASDDAAQGLDDLEPIVGLGGLSPAEVLDVLARTTDLELRIENGRLLVAR